MKAVRVSAAPVVLAAAIAAGLAVTLAGCGHGVDEAAWRKDLAGAGVTVGDWPKYRKLVEDTCSQDDPSTFVAVALDKGQPTMRELEIDYQHACPDRMSHLKDAIRKVEESTGAADLACKTPPDQRTQDQKDLAEAMGC